MLAIQWFLLRRAVFQQVLNKSSPGMSEFQFYRLLAIAIAQACCTLATSIYNLVSTLSAPGVSGTLYPWISWQSIHSGFHRVFQFPYAIFSDAEVRSFLASGSVPAGAAVLFFLLFGLTSEILGDGHKALRWIQRRVLRHISPWSGASKGKVNPAQTIQSFSSYVEVMSFRATSSFDIWSRF